MKIGDVFQNIKKSCKMKNLHVSFAKNRAKNVKRNPYYMYNPKTNSFLLHI